MDYHEFVGELQHRLELPEMGETVRAIRAVLTTLGERVQEGEASNQAGALRTRARSTVFDRIRGGVHNSTEGRRSR